MPFELVFTPEATAVLKDLERPECARKLAKVRKALAQLEEDPRYPALRSHRLQSFPSPTGEAVYDSYVENHTPAAWRIYWSYGPEASQLTVHTIGPHPD
jgi:hypothetical protein